jgi:uncharacterized membrane protein YccC
MSKPRHWPHRLLEQAALQPDVARAWREAVALGAPLMICHALGWSADAPFVAMATQTVALHDLRGAYGMRLVIAATMTAVVVGAVFLGAVSGGSVVTATLAMGLVALLNGLWRHLSADYGPALGVSSSLLFLLGLAHTGPRHVAEGLHLAGLVALGGLGATLLQVGFWLFRPQHPLRAAVAETWVGASDLIAAMQPDEHPAARPGLSHSEAIAKREQELRAALNRTFAILHAAETHPRRAAFVAHLEEMRREVVHLTMRATALDTAFEPLLERPELARALPPALDSLLRALSNTARSVAITLISHRVENFALSEVRLRRCQHLIRVLDDQLASVAGGETGVAVAQARAALEQIGQTLPHIRDGLKVTVDHAAARFSFPPTLPELSSRSVHSVAAWINPAPQLDPVLLRHIARMAVLTMLAVALYKGFHIPRGYWIALTIMVVLQPDYGSTRQRAAERIGGTLAGSLLASALLWIRLPLWLLDICAALTCLGFAYFLKRDYGKAVFFVTLMVVLITETTTPVHLDFTVSRLLSTLLGGGLALLAAWAFWPVWERQKFSALLAAAVRANRVYLESLAARLGITLADADPDPLHARRRAEDANRFAAASLQRLLSEPGNRRESAERESALAAYNQRLTWALTGLAVQAPDDAIANDAGIAAAVGDILNGLESLARAIEQDGGESEATAAAAELAENLGKLDGALAPPPLAVSRATTASATDLIWNQLARSIAEIRAMTLALEPPRAAPSKVEAPQTR